MYCILLSDPYPLKTLSSFENAIKWASSREFQDQDIKEAKLSVFQEVSKIVGSYHILHNFHALHIQDWVLIKHWTSLTSELLAYLFI